MPKYSIITRTTGLEPALLGVTGQYFNPLSYVLAAAYSQQKHKVGPTLSNFNT